MEIFLLSATIIAILIIPVHCIISMRPDPQLKKEMKRIMEKKKENIKRQIERNLAARKRKDLIYDLVESCNFRDINIDYDSDRFYVIIKIHKDALIEREIKNERENTI